jgi:hypothetical protein
MQPSTYFVASVQPDGDLLLTADAEAIEWMLDELQLERSEDMILLYGMEGYWTNGSYWPFDAGLGNPFVGLTGAPCIAEDLDIDESFNRSVVGRLWAFLDYQVKSLIDELATKGQVRFTLVANQTRPS